MTQFYLEAFQWHGVKRGDAFAFYAGDIRVEGPHPLCSSGGNLGTGRRCRTAMCTASIEQRRGTAGPRQVKVGAEERRLDHVRKTPELTVGDSGGHPLAAITLSPRSAVGENQRLGASVGALVGA